MKNTTFISAGAGSGKTYRLTEEIVKAIRSGECRADEIILTTYTTAAAAELREKVRSALYKEGLFDAAIDLDNAAIGTIHSIANTMMSQYWYILGISSDVSIMSDEDKAVYMSQSLASIASENDITLFTRMVKALNITKDDDTFKPITNYDFWKDDLSSIIDKMVDMCIDETELEESIEASKQLIANTFSWRDINITNDDIAKIIEYHTKLSEVIAAHARTNGEEKLKQALQMLTPLTAYRGGAATLPLYGIYKIASLYSKPSKYLEKECSAELLFMHDIAEKVCKSNDVRNMAELYIDTIFRMARQWQKEYREFKDQRGLYDYSDMLDKFYKLLQNEAVKKEIGGRYKIVLVDEFQDCSPIQVRAFGKLSEIINRSIWVGDIKQAIYRFRGSNPELIKSVIKEVKDTAENGNSTYPLEFCWRSNQHIINTVNDIFCKVFSTMDEKLVKLEYPKRDSGDEAPAEHKPVHWQIKGKNKDIINENLALRIQELHESGYDYSDIAVLIKSNSYIKECANTFRELGIPVNIKLDREKAGGIGDDVTDLITAIISLAAYAKNELSKAIIVNNVEEECTTSAIISSRLRYLEGDKKEAWLADKDIIKRLEAIRGTIETQSIKSAVETIATELNLIDLIKRVDPEAHGYEYISALIKMAEAYEGTCRNLSMCNSLRGFAEHLKTSGIARPGDENGVTISTYHRSKGLQWRCVILFSVNNEIIKEDYTLFGVQTRNTAERTELSLIPTGLKSFCIDETKAKMWEQPFFTGIKDECIEEAKRLFYVGMTRACERLIVATVAKDKNATQWPDSIGCPQLDSKSDAKVVKWGDYEWDNELVEYETEEDEAPRVDSVCATSFKALRHATNKEEYAPKHLTPSGAEPVEDTYNMERCTSFAERISLTAKDAKDSTIGNFIHHLMCLWDDNADMEALIDKLATTYGVTVESKELISSVRNFWEWMRKEFGEAVTIERELPFSYIRENGQYVDGEIDLVYRTATKTILVDYKTHQGKISHILDKNDTKHYVGKYSGQIALYDEALTRAGLKVDDRLICYLSLGTAVRMTPNK